MRQRSIIPNTEITGTLHIVCRHVGSKSEGQEARLTDGDGKAWTLYRPGLLAADDPYFRPFDGTSVTVTGDAEPATAAFCVRTIVPESDHSAVAATESSILQTPIPDKASTYE